MKQLNNINYGQNTYMNDIRSFQMSSNIRKKWTLVFIQFLNNFKIEKQKRLKASTS